MKLLHHATLYYLSPGSADGGGSMDLTEAMAIFFTVSSALGCPVVVAQTDLMQESLFQK